MCSNIPKVLLNPHKDVRSFMEKGSRWLIRELTKPSSAVPGLVTLQTHQSLSSYPSPQKVWFHSEHFHSQEEMGPSKIPEEHFHILCVITPFPCHLTSTRLPFHILHRKTICGAAYLPRSLGCGGKPCPGLGLIKPAFTFLS